MKVTDLTTGQFKALIKEAVGEKLEEMLGDPERKSAALDALREIQEAFKRSGITGERSFRRRGGESGTS